ncbi:hypothetical protein EVG20_g1903 [Dentipellis fragilis]|uniref:F-box domain-containing protein n=1 Tax=Dentipellis fragilis TaxID=205917 RepID=A0A4Y9Z9F6_9AGAM|nr:hypothetical protein EVG20_g1903 [Dentipellis fragilis]
MVPPVASIVSNDIKAAASGHSRGLPPLPVAHIGYAMSVPPRADTVQSASNFWGEVFRARIAEFGDSASTDVLDAEIASINEMRQKLNARRNSRALISCLPAEVMLLIFGHLRDTSPIYLQPSIAHLGWVTVTHVSQDWRQLCLGDPSLWAKIESRLPDKWLQLFLIRSGTMSLSLTRQHGYYSTTVQEFDVLHDYHSRIQKLVLTVAPSSEQINRLISGFDRQFPMLNSLKLSRRIRFESLTLRQSMELPDDFLVDLDTYPELHSLSLEDFIIPWTSQLFARLTHLEISLHGTPINTEAGYTQTDFINCL